MLKGGIRAAGWFWRKLSFAEGAVGKRQRCPGAGGAALAAAAFPISCWQPSEARAAQHKEAYARHSKGPACTAATCCTPGRGNESFRASSRSPAQRMGISGAGATRDMKFIAFAHQQRSLAAPWHGLEQAGAMRGSGERAAGGKQPGPASAGAAGPREGCRYQGEGRIWPQALGSAGLVLPGCKQPWYWKSGVGLRRSSTCPCSLRMW